MRHVIHRSRWAARSGLLALTAALAGGWSGAAAAQSATNPPPLTAPTNPALEQTASGEDPVADQLGAKPVEEGASAGAAPDIVVTGSRVSRPGYSSPTPVTALNSDELLKASPSRVVDALRTLPALTNTSGTQRNSGSAGGGQSFLDLRGLGAVRTLTLVDGRRFVPTSVTNTVDANILPSSLIQRVDVVTGGASAAYGSDAVAGVVNFVLDKQYDGVKLSAQTGISTYGDNGEVVASGAFGKGFFDDRLHVIGSAEYFKSREIAGDARPWSRRGNQIITDPGGQGTAERPAQILSPDVRLVSSYAGLILSGSGGSTAANSSFRDITFRSDGTPTPYDFGTLTTSGTQVGGDGVDNGVIQQINRPLERLALFSHADLKLTDAITLFGEVSYGRTQSNYFSNYNTHTSTSPQTQFITIRQDNAFLPDALRQQMIIRGVTGLTMSRYDREDGGSTVHNLNETQRYVGGLEAKLGSGWKFGGYYEWGVNDNTNIVRNTNIVANFNKAVDAVRDPSSGQIVCRSTLTDRSDGCAPFNPFGVGNASAEAVSYVNGNSPAFTRTTEELAAVNLSGSPFSTWAGSVSIAMGGEYRRQTARVRSDVLSVANAYKLGNQQPWSGDYDIREGYAEIVVPLARDLPLLKELDANGAVRYTDYSTSGGVTTWKGGASYRPVEGIRFRLTRSRDIRAPNLNELFTAGRQQVATVRDPFRNNVTVPNISVLQPGNPNLRPEKADTLTYGVVLQPAQLRGLQLSADFYSVSIGDAIATVANQVVLDQCFAGATDLCALITRDAANNITRFVSSPINYSRLKTSGIDFETTYKPPLSEWISGWEGDLTFRIIGNYVRHFTTEAPGLVTRDVAGSIVDNMPRWRGIGQIDYARGGFNATVIGRYVGGGNYDVSRTPAQLGLRDTEGQTVFDGQASYDPPFAKRTTLFVNVRNIFNNAPPVAPTAGNLTIGTNPFLYDTIGRMFRVGIRITG